MNNTIQADTRTLPGIILASSDYERLVDLASEPGRATPQVADYLTRELARAQVVSDESFGAQIARVGSRVTYTEDQGGRQREVTLVWPHDANVEQNRISVLTSIGAALLGLSAGQSIDWASPLGGVRTLTVVAVA